MIKKIQEFIACSLCFRHTGVLGSSVHYMGTELEQTLQLPVQLVDSDLPYRTGEEQNTAVIQVYDDLCKLLRQLDDLPLTFASLQGVSPSFRYTEVEYF